MANRIFITGDCHGIYRKLNNKNFTIAKTLDKEDFLIICGDFGGVWSKNIESKEEKWWLDWLNERPYSVLFIDGNHENFDRLNNYDEEVWNGGKVNKIRSHVLHLMRGEIFTIAGKTFFTFGGARSHDISDGILDENDEDYKFKRRIMQRENKLFRTIHIDWWKEEIASNEEMKNALTNLKKYDYSIDYIITHCAPTSIHEILKGDNDVQTDFFEEIKSKCNYKKWYFGHYHDDRNISEDEILVYNKIIELI